MKKIIILGAFDRYNYGDNLMPILFEMFLSKYCPGILNEFKLEFVALTNSDLSEYGVKKTKSLKCAVRNGDPQAIISIGGEVLCASSSALFLHMNHPKMLVGFIRFLRKVKLKFVADLLCRRYYGLPWEYPYIPDPHKYPNVGVALNTIGGSVPDRGLSDRIYKIKRRLTDAAYLSVRDARTQRSLESFCDANVYPDSALLMSDVVDDSFLYSKITKKISGLLNRKYIVFQAAPHKVGASVESVVACLRSLSSDLGAEVVLCPIGYAKGHDDRDFLSLVNSHASGEFRLLDDLNVWEIMYVIKNSCLFLGTSLHGVITAISYGVPHLGINRNVSKLDQFLVKWSVQPMNRCYAIPEIYEVAIRAMSVPGHHLAENSNYLRNLVIKNNFELIRSLKLDA